MVRLGVCLFIAAGLPSLAQADPLRDAASDAVDCRGVTDPSVRLACFDTTAGPLAAALGVSPVDSVPPRQPETPPQVAAAPVDTAAALATEPAPKPVVPATGPTWAAAPAPSPAPDDPEPDAREFTATIVRITRNNAGRHFFYTEDGAVWEQTQIEEIVPPRSLPAPAEFRRRLAGNPTITFEHSSRAYRVRRIE